jgi:hypothetical protein
MAQLLWSGMFRFFLPCIPNTKNKKRKQPRVTVGSHVLAAGAKLRGNDGRKQDASAI